MAFGLTAFAQQSNKDYSKILYSKNIYEIDAFLRDAHPDDPKRVVLKPRLIDLINDYLRKASPEDQSVPLLQSKLALLKTRTSTKISFEEMNANIRKKQIEYYQKKLAEINSGNYNPSASGQEAIASSGTKTPAENDKIKAEKDRLLAMNTASTKNTSSSAPAKSNTAAMMSSSEADEFKLLMNESADEHKRKTVGLLNKLFDNDPSSKEVVVMIENKSDCDMIMRIDGVGYTKYRLPIAAHKENSIVIPKGSYLFSSLVCGAQYSSQKTVDKNIILGLNNPK